VTSGFPALSAHVVVRAGCDRDRVLRGVELLLHERFGITHTTLQMVEQAPGDGLIQVERG
jgi:cobalt-zinc-cadmium efflux system protein